MTSGMTHAARPGQPGTSARPASVAYAAYLLLVRAALTLLNVLVGVVLLAGVGPWSVGSIAGALAAAGLLGLLAALVISGVRWARIATWAVLGLFILANLVAQGQPLAVPQRAIALGLLALDIAVVVLLALAPSNAYFSRRR